MPYKVPCLMLWRSHLPGKIKFISWLLESCLTTTAGVQGCLRTFQFVFYIWLHLPRPKDEIWSDSFVWRQMWNISTMKCSKTCGCRGVRWRIFKNNLVFLHWPTTIRRIFNRIHWPQSLLDFAFFGAYFSFGDLANLGLRRVNTDQRLEAKGMGRKLVGQEDTCIDKICGATLWV